MEGFGGSTTNDTRTPHLIFGDDGADASHRAWRWLQAHDWSDWRIDVLTADTDVTHVEWGKPADLQPWTPPWERDTSGMAVSSVRFLRAATDPRAMLADVEADLMVVGIKPPGRLGPVVTGSTTEWLMHHPPTPLAIVRRADVVRRVLVCADGSEHSLRAVETFRRLPFAAHTEVTVLAVDDGRVDPDGAAATAQRLAGGVGSVEARVAFGKPTDAILTEVARLEPDLVVLGTRGLTGWKRLRLGSTASAVVRSVPADCLLACVEGR